MMNSPTVAVVTTFNNAITDTFIQAHIKHLSGTIHAYYGMPMPIHSAEGDILHLQIPKWKRALPAFLYERIRWEQDNPQNIIEKLYRHQKINVVLAEYGHTGSKVMSVCKKLSLPLIVHFHGHDAFRDSMIDTFGKTYKEMFSYASYIISVSKAMTLQLQKLGAPAEKIIYNPYGPREDFFNVEPDYTSGNFLSVGRFVEKKAPYLTLLAFRKMQQHFPHARLIMVGDGPLLPVCKNIASGLGIQNVEFKGAMPHADVIDLYAHSCCLVQHSVIASDGDSEGTPLAVLEAGAAGLPTVSTLHAGIPDVVIDGETGFLVKEGDIDGMADRMGEIYSSVDLRTAMGQAARQRIAANFAMKRHIDTINELIKSVVN